MCYRVIYENWKIYHHQLPTWRVVRRRRDYEPTEIKGTRETFIYYYVHMYMEKKDRSMNCARRYG